MSLTPKPLRPPHDCCDGNKWSGKLADVMKDLSRAEVVNSVDSPIEMVKNCLLIMSAIHIPLKADVFTSFEIFFRYDDSDPTIVSGRPKNHGKHSSFDSNGVVL